MAGKFIVTGIKELDKKLKELEKDSVKVVRKVLRAEQKQISQAVKAALPKETGRSKKQVKVRSGKRSRNHIRINTVAFDTEKWYQVFTEYGSKKQKAQGNWRRVWDSRKATVKKNIIQAIWQGIRTFVRK